MQFWLVSLHLSKLIWVWVIVWFLKVPIKYNWGRGSEMVIEKFTRKIAWNGRNPDLAILTLFAFSRKIHQWNDDIRLHNTVSQNIQERRVVNNWEVEKGTLISSRALVSFLSVITVSSSSCTLELLTLATISSFSRKKELKLELVELILHWAFNSQKAAE